MIATDPPWRLFEREIQSLLAGLDPNASVLRDVFVKGSWSTVQRQLDALVTGRIVGERFQIAIECKHLSRPVDVPLVEAFWAKLHDVAADRGSIFSSRGFTQAARNFAANASPPKVTLHEPSRGWTDLAFATSSDEVLEMARMLEARRVLVIKAGPGSGRSTLVPFELRRLLGTGPSGEFGQLVVVEPLISVTKGLATYVSTTLAKSRPGPGNYVGYHVGGDQNYDARTSLVYATDGAFVSRLRLTGLQGISLVFLDDPQLRTANQELILGLLRWRLDENRDLRIVLASDDPDAEFLMDYFGGPERVAHFQLPSVIRWGYGDPLWPAREIDLEAWPPFGPPDAAADKIDLRSQTQALSTCRPSRPVSLAGPSAEIFQAVISVVTRLLDFSDDGDILAFLPTHRAIARAVATLEDMTLASDVDVRGLTARSELPDREAALRRGVRRRVVFASVIAELGLAPQDFRYVVDSGLTADPQWDPDLGFGGVTVAPHNKAGIRRRWGLVGRSEPGWVFPVYSSEEFALLPDHGTPKVLQEGLERFVLAAREMDNDLPSDAIWPTINDSARPEVVERFSMEMQRATGTLLHLGALDPSGKLTARGRDLLDSRLPYSIEGSSALLDGREAGCLGATALFLELFEAGRLVGVGGLLSASDATRRWIRDLCSTVGSETADDLDVIVELLQVDRRGTQALAGNRPAIKPEVLNAAKAAAATTCRLLGDAPREIDIDRSTVPTLRGILAVNFAQWRYRRQVDGTYIRLSDPDQRPVAVDPVVLVRPAGDVIALRRRRNQLGQPEISHLVEVRDGGTE